MPPKILLSESIDVKHSRRPWIAFLVGIAAPGVGHIYAGNAKRGVLGWLFFAAAFGTMLVLMYTLPLGTISIPIGIAIGFGTWLAVAIDAEAVARRASPDFQPRWYNRWYVYLGLILALRLVGDLPERIIDAYRIPSDSMCPALCRGDLLFAKKTRSATTAPSRFQVLVYRSPVDPDLEVLKRVAGVSGDTLAMVDGHLFVNGVAAADDLMAPINDEEALESTDDDMAWHLPYLVGDSTDLDYRPTLGTWGPLVVPPDSVFMLGDARDGSYDSRYYGFVANANVTGRAHVIYYSFDPSLRSPLKFLTAVRWDRIGTTF